MKEDKISAPYEQFKRKTQDVLKETDVSIRLVRDNDEGFVEIGETKKEPRKHEALFRYEKFGDSIELEPLKTDSKKAKDIQREIEKMMENEK